MSKEECWCFPEENEFTKQYKGLMKGDKYLAEKTTPTMVQHLAGTNKKSYDVVPYYAHHDFMENLGCLDQNKNILNKCAVFNMSADINILKIQKSLELIAKPCKCEL